LAAGVARVVVGQPDPHPLASGGAGRLTQAGVAVAFAPPGSPAALAAADVAEVFLTGERQQRAWLQLKLAATIDGKTAAADGSSQWITGPASRQAVHQLRAEADAVLVGSGTALADNPRLDVRHLPDYAGPLPLRVVVDRRLRLPTTHLLCDTSSQPTRVYTLPEQLNLRAHKQLEAQGVQVVAVADGRDWLQRVLGHLGATGCHQLLCEGGATLATALLRDRLVDRLDVMLGPILLGQGVPLLGDLGIISLQDAQHWRWSPPQTCGDDLWLTARPLQLQPATAH
jgi:diaminohydroxyphosphoribosylaminopyrimidine deaminase/5-amino-6-(5-phosphoribosylamino)uracil reductase